MHLPEIDKYAGLHSVFHSWDERFKISSLALLIVSIALLPDVLLASIGFIIAVIFLLLSKIPVAFVFRQLRWVLLFLLLFIIVMPLTTAGDYLVKIGAIGISRQGIRLAVLISLRALSICLLIFPMIGTAEFHKSIKALHRLKLPNILVQMLIFSYRYIFIFMEAHRRMFTSAGARLFEKKTNIFTFRTMGNLTGMLLIRCFEKTESVYNAMVSRGYKGEIRTLDEFKAAGGDFAKAAFVITLALLLNLARLIA